MVALFQLFVRLFVNLMMRDQTPIPGFPARFCFIELTFGRMAISCKYNSDSNCTVVEESCQGYFCLQHFFFLTHFHLVSLMARKVWRHSDSVSAVHDRHSHARNCTGLPSNICLFLSTGNKNLFLLQRHLSPFDS